MENNGNLLTKRNILWENVGWMISVLLLIYLKFFVHELWKDEWQAWFVAKDKNILEVFSFLNYEGHPALWYLYLKPFAWIYSFLPLQEEYILSFAHLLPAIAVFYIFWKKFEIPDLVKSLFTFSYFFIFEYGLVNRGYILVILFLFLAVFYLQKDNLKLLAISLFLLCQTEVFGVFMAAALGAYLLLNNVKKYAVPLQYLTIGGILFVISVYPRESGHIARTQGKILSFGDRIFTSVQGNITNAFLPGVTDDTAVFGWTIFGMILTILMLVLFVYLFKNYKQIWVPLLLVILMSTGFSLFFFVGGIRQWGMMFVFFVALLSLAPIAFYQKKANIFLLSLIGLVQSIYGLTAVYQDITLPFTNAKETGLFILEKIPEKVPIVAINKFEITPVIGYAKRKFYELPSGEPFSYFKWVEKIYMPTQEELRLFAKFKNVGGLVIISPKRLDPGRFSEATLGKEFTTKNIKNENYFIYTLAVK